MALTVVIARRLGSADLGQFTYMVSLVAILDVIADLGLSAFYIREAHLGRNDTLAGVVLGTRLVSGVLAGTCLATYAALVRLDHSLATLLFLGSLLLVLGAFPSFVAAVLRAKELMVYEAMTKVVGALVNTAGATLLVLAGWGIVSVAVAMVGVACGTLVFYGWLASRYMPRPLRLRRSVAVYAATLRSAWPFAGLAILVVIYFRIDSLMLFALKGQTALGQYGAAYRLMEAALLVPLTLAGSALPTVARFLQARTDHVLTASTKAIHFLSILSMPAAVFGAIFAPQAFLLLYGAGFEEASRIFRVLVFTLIAVFASSVTSNIITASSRPVVNMYIAGVMVVLNVSLNFLFIPQWSGMGAAAATVITEATGLILGTLYIRRRIAPFAYSGALLKPALASLLVGALVMLFPLFAALPLYVVCYLGVLWFMRGLTSEDLNLLKQLLSRPRAALLPGA